MYKFIKRTNNSFQSMGIGNASFYLNQERANLENYEHELWYDLEYKEKLLIYKYK